ncbi:regulatory protein, luxR family [Haloechinothrix alba]|uniref:Regulatory protein, luxR family n=1 Tax=Haloechinothrix alba TaxID=664784 RepID=A0A238XMF5_9PSEU|nr:helix-turn-helix transcriptional regulator [Haloechinothrix alba]SNR59751.1 regulatory protein, luxR family [Haloechinothrix alba]
METSDVLVAAREAYSRHDWHSACKGFAAAREQGELSPDDCHAAAKSAWWLGRIAECLEGFEEAYRRFLAAGQPLQAAMSALLLGIHSQERGETARGSAWLSRVRRLVADEPDSAVHGYLLYTDMFATMGDGDVENALSYARRMEALGNRLGDPNVAALGVLGQGRALVKQGLVGDGLSLLDEAMLAAVSDQLDPTWAGAIYCHLMDVCQELLDLRRAVEWTMVATRQLDVHPEVSTLPGICRVHRAQVLQVQGDWRRAEREASRACQDMSHVHVLSAAEGHYELGEIRRLKGDRTGAEESFKHAHRLGRDPQPGLALLRLTEGRVDVAVGSLRAALACERNDRLKRARLCAAQVEVATVAGDLTTAAGACAELESTAHAYGSSGLEATASQARGRVHLAEGSASEALAALRAACRSWQDLDAPYEAARTRVLIAEAYRALGDDSAVELELEAARVVFQRLGAATDARHAAERAASAPLPGGLSDREVEVLRLVATGRSNREIAAELVISEKTVHRHLSNIFGKLELSSRTAAAAFAYDHGLVSQRDG